MELNLRHISRDDIDGIIALSRAVSDADDGDSVLTHEKLAAQFDMPGLDITKVVWVVPGDDGNLDATVSAVPLPSGEQETIHVSVEVHPRRRGQGWEERLLRFAEAQVPNVRTLPELPGLLHMNVRSTRCERIELCERSGYSAVRWFLVLERPLTEAIGDLPAPEGVSVEPVDADSEAEALFLVIDESFRDHWNPVSFTLDQFRHMAATMGSSPILTLLARDADGEPAAVCMTRVEGEKNEARGTKEGYIISLGVRRPWRGQGLARHMLLRSLGWLRDQGMDVATLGVDANSPTGANRLYESVGFRERKRTVVYQKPAE